MTNAKFSRCPAFFLADGTQPGISMVPVPSHLSKALFPRMARSRRGRRIVNCCLWLFGGALLIGLIVGVLYLVYQQAKI